MEKLIRLLKDYSIPTMDYAIAGNAFLGIKEAGKTVTAKKCAEGLMEQIKHRAINDSGIDCAKRKS